MRTVISDRISSTGCLIRLEIFAEEALGDGNIGVLKKVSLEFF